MSATAKHQPATPLPYTANGNRIYNSDGQRIVNVALRHAEYPEFDKDAAYLAHAANAYPKLIEALRWSLSLLEKPNGSHTRTYQVRYEHAAVLLRELGEAS